MNQPGSDSTCLNCHQPLLGKFCHHCGQSASVERITFHDTLSDFFSASFALDGPLLRTTRLLIVRPATILREFTEGRRKSYYKPVAYFVLLTAIYILLRSLIGYDPFNERMDQMQANDQVNTNLLQEAGIYMFKNINNILFLLVFGMALSFKLFFPKRFLLAEYVAMGFYISGIYILFGTLTMFWNHYTPYDLGGIHLIFLIAYITYVAAALSAPPSFGRIFRSLLTGILSLLLYLSLAFGLSLLIVWIG